MEQLKTILARLFCVIVIATSVYRGFLEPSADWPERVLSLCFAGLLLLYLLLDIWGSRLRKAFPILSFLNFKLIHLRINDKRTEVYSADGQKVFSVANQFVWRSGKRGWSMVAIGTPEEWLPSRQKEDLEDVSYTDLVAEANPSTPHIKEMWSAFVLYCELAGHQKAGIGFWRRLYQSRFSPLQIDLRLSDPFKRQFVADILGQDGLSGLIEVIYSGPAQPAIRRAALIRN